MQQLIEMAAQLFLKQLGSTDTSQLGAVVSGLKDLLPTEGGDLDMTALIAKFSGNGGNLMKMASSWLGDGQNDAFDASEVMGLFGDSAVADFASKVGVPTDQAASGLAGMIPELIDKASSGGSLMENAASGLGKKLLGSLF